EMLKVHDGARTEAGLRENIRVALQYIEAWLRGRGAVPLYNLMEDAATAEISRAQVWQWIGHGAALDDGRIVDAGLFNRLLDEEVRALREALGETFQAGRFPQAIQVFADLCLSDNFEEFLTLPAYRIL